ncbi:hypothetical protein O6H91_15G048500 [Diphasiastrum complanatum]|uniref:Uncharacterized protein n=1 Tax=Diphasiastrum complanatum TaxID=34168 RepID=A0ACC2BI42_DIPCM|nr:hypothetical protein O6H91_15G048500 [Diphasiastrum complanatum]
MGFKSKSSLEMKQSSRELSLPPTSTALQKKALLKDEILKIFAERKLRTGAFGTVESELDQKAWRMRPNALQSRQARNLKKSMDQRKLRMKEYMKKSLFADIFKGAEQTQEGGEAAERMEAAGTVEQVAHDLIEKTADLQNREKHGVWSQLGKPYTCLGVPAFAIPKECPMLEGAESDPVKDNVLFQFFQPPPKSTEEIKFLEQTVPIFKKRRESLLKYLRASTNMQRILNKMGLLHVHDAEHTRFSRKPLEAVDHLRKTIKAGAIYSCSNTTDIPNANLSDPTLKGCNTLLDQSHQSFVRCGDDGLATRCYSVSQNSPGYDTLTLGKNNGLLRVSLGDSVGTAPLSEFSRPMLLDICGSLKQDPEIDSPDDESVVFDWRKQFLMLQQRLQKELMAKLTAQNVRREHCRSSSLYTAEVAGMLISHLRECLGRKSPISTLHIWKCVEEKQAKEKVVSAPLCPELESIKIFYSRVCSFVRNQKMDDPLMEILIHHLKDLLEHGFKLQKNLLSSLCQRLAGLPDHVESTGRMSCLMPILHFICKDLHISSTEFHCILSSSGLELYSTLNSRSPSIFVSPVAIE